MKFKFKKGDLVCVKRVTQGYWELREDIGVVVHSDQVYSIVMFQCHDNPLTVDHTYRIATNDLEFVRDTKILSKRYSSSFSIIDVIFNDPAVIVLWADGSKTVVKCSENDIFDPEKGLAMAISKKALGNQGNYYNTFNKYLPEEEECEAVTNPFAELTEIWKYALFGSRHNEESK